LRSGRRGTWGPSPPPSATPIPVSDVSRASWHGKSGGICVVICNEPGQNCPFDQNHPRPSQQPCVSFPEDGRSFPPCALCPGLQGQVLQSAQKLSFSKPARVTKKIPGLFCPAPLSGLDSAPSNDSPPPPRPRGRWRRGADRQYGRHSSPVDPRPRRRPPRRPPLPSPEIRMGILVVNQPLPQ